MDEQKLKALMDSIYVICVALVAITDFEHCTYNFDDAVEMARKYADDYEADHENNT